MVPELYSMPKSRDAQISRTMPDPVLKRVPMMSRAV